MTTGKLLSAAVGASLLGVCAGALAAPKALAKTYGLPVESPEALGFVRALGVRDGVLGAIVLALLGPGNRGALATAVGFSTFAAVGDFTVVVATAESPPPQSLAIHASGVVGLFAAWAMLRGEGAEG